MMFHSYTVNDPVLLWAVPELLKTERHDLWYYLAGAALFLILGIIAGYFIWRRSHLQFAEIRHEKTHAIAALQKFSEEIEKEERMLDNSPEAVGSELAAEPKKKSLKTSPQKLETLPAVDTVPHASDDFTKAIEPPVNPVAKVMREDASSSSSESDDEL